MTIKLHRRRIILASLVFALGIAVFLNWQFSSKDNSNEINESTDGHYVDSQVSDIEVKKNISEEFSTNDYYKNARANRDLAYKQSLATMKEILLEPNLDEKTKIELEKQYSEMAKILVTQTNIENLVKAKGYKECFAIIQNGECHLTVSIPEENNSEEEKKKHLIRLLLVVESQTGFGKEKIKIIIKESEPEIVKLK